MRDRPFSAAIEPQRVEFGIDAELAKAAAFERFTHREIAAYAWASTSDEFDLQNHVARARDQL